MIRTPEGSDRTIAWRVFFVGYLPYQNVTSIFTLLSCELCHASVVLHCLTFFIAGEKDECLCWHLCIQAGAAGYPGRRLPALWSSLLPASVLWGLHSIHLGVWWWFSDPEITKQVELCILEGNSYPVFLLQQVCSNYDLKSQAEPHQTCIVAFQVPDVFAVPGRQQTRTFSEPLIGCIWPSGRAAL